MTRFRASAHAGCLTGILIGLTSPADRVDAQSYPARPIRYLDLPDIRECPLGLGAEVIAGAPAKLTERMKAQREHVIKVVGRIEAREGKR